MQITTTWRKPSRGSGKQILKIETEVTPAHPGRLNFSPYLVSMTVTFYDNPHLDVPHFAVRGGLAYPESLDALAAIATRAAALVIAGCGWSDYEI